MGRANEAGFRALASVRGDGATKSGVAPRTEFCAAPHVAAALAGIGRTEDLRLSPNDRRLVIAGFARERCLVLDVEFDTSREGMRIRSDDFVEIVSPNIESVHGVDFIDEETLAVANRSGSVAILKLPTDALGGRTISLSALATLSRTRFHRLHSPGSVAAVPLGNGRHELLVCNNAAGRVTRHVADTRNGFRVIRTRILLERGLDLPDGISVSRDRKWIAVSSHSTHNVLIFENTMWLGRRSEPVGVLEGLAYPHGVRFTPDGRCIFVADAGAPCVLVFAAGESWRGKHDPVASITIMDDETFQSGRADPREGGPKGIDFDNQLRLLATTCETQPLAFFDVANLFSTSTYAEDLAPT